jgi:hypothetical protein
VIESLRNTFGLVRIDRYAIDDLTRLAAYSRRQAQISSDQPVWIVASALHDPGETVRDGLGTYDSATRRLIAELPKVPGLNGKAPLVLVVEGDDIRQIAQNTQKALGLGGRPVGVSLQWHGYEDGSIDTGSAEIRVSQIQDLERMFRDVVKPKVKDPLTVTLVSCFGARRQLDSIRRGLEGGCSAAIWATKMGVAIAEVEVSTSGDVVCAVPRFVDPPDVVAALYRAANKPADNDTVVSFSGGMQEIYKEKVPQGVTVRLD